MNSTNVSWVICCKVALLLLSLETLSQIPLHFVVPGQSCSKTGTPGRPRVWKGRRSYLFLKGFVVRKSILLSFPASIGHLPSLALGSCLHVQAQHLQIFPFKPYFCACVSFSDSDLSASLL